jgi:hypothetical protein
MGNADRGHSRVSLATARLALASSTRALPSGGGGDQGSGGGVVELTGEARWRRPCISRALESARRGVEVRSVPGSAAGWLGPTLPEGAGSARRGTALTAEPASSQPVLIFPFLPEPLDGVRRQARRVLDEGPGEA